MARYASDANAYGISDRSGFRYRLRNMQMEWNGLLVGKDEYEPKHPQLTPRKSPKEPQALRNPRPETGLSEQRNLQYGFNPVGFHDHHGLIENNLKAAASVGTVTVTT